MNPVLDEIENESLPKKTFSKLSLGISIITMALVFYMLGQAPTTIKANETMNMIPSELIIGIYVTCLTGFS